MNANLLLLVHEEKLASCSSWLQSKEMIMSNNKTGARFSFPFLTARNTRKRGSKKFFFMKSRKTIILLPCIATISEASPAYRTKNQFKLVTFLHRVTSTRVNFYYHFPVCCVQQPKMGLCVSIAASKPQTPTTLLSSLFFVLS